jgi:hypothetical protein
MSVMTCIYCCQVGPAPFPKEHVVPQAFGHFHENLTLSCVCGACNSLCCDLTSTLFVTILDWVRSLNMRL